MLTANYCFVNSTLQLLSRTKAAEDPAKKQEATEKQKKKLPELEDFLQKRDYSGAIALLEVSIFIKSHLFYFIVVSIQNM